MEETLTLDQIVTEFVEEKEIKPFIEFLENKIIPLCGKIASQNLQRVEKHEWSRKVPINESIENVYQFFKQEINPIMAEQYMNLIRQEKKGHVKVKILPKSEYKNKDYYFNEIDEKGKVHIYFNETPYDMFAIIHEMIHQMNETYERIDNEKYQTELAQYFTESPSIMAEKLLGKWLVKNKKITHNDLCEKVLRQPYPKIETEEWSRKIDINESIEYNYKFLKTISPMLAEQFLNILNQNDENDKRVSILPFSNEYKCRQYTNEGKVFVYYKNTPEDIFTLLHEMIHAMNYSSKTTGRTYGQLYISEVPTHIIENLLGKWLLKNNVITQNDYNKYKKWRLEYSKEVSWKLLIEKELVDMKLKKGLYITKARVNEIIKNKCHINNSKDFGREELEQCCDGLNSILRSGNLRFIDYQRYVIGQYIADKVEKSENPEKAFLKFHNFEGNVNLSPDRILRIIRKDYQQEDIDRS